MQNRYDWTCYTSRIKKRSFFVSFLFHFSLFILFLIPLPQKKKDFVEREVFVVKLVNISQIEMPEITEKKEIKVLEKGISSLKKEEIKSPKEKVVEKKVEFTEKFSPEEYKKKLYSKISNIEQITLPSKTPSQNINIKIPEIKSIQINTPSFESSSYQPSFTTEIPSWYINLIRKKIEENWLLKEYLIDMSAIISFRIYRDGKIENVSIEKSSGYKKFDNSIIEAIKSVKVWPKFPEEIRDRYIDIIIEFKTEG
ncbi:MAG: TonB family protein [Candidatus Omnitrophica bacterium]|nr:TonB family protein [Candidatus Omnitrophota bacterium]MCM8803461.1 TonB family protein [Candidatus Omnitrophota bacterium]